MRNWKSWVWILGGASINFIVTGAAAFIDWALLIFLSISFPVSCGFFGEAVDVWVSTDARIREEETRHKVAMLKMRNQQIERAVEKECKELLP